MIIIISISIDTDVYVYWDVYHMLHMHVYCCFSLIHTDYKQLMIRRQHKIVLNLYWLLYLVLCHLNLYEWCMICDVYMIDICLHVYFVCAVIFRSSHCVKHLFLESCMRRLTVQLYLECSRVCWIVHSRCFTRAVYVCDSISCLGNGTFWNDQNKLDYVNFV